MLSIFKKIKHHEIPSPAVSVRNHDGDAGHADIAIGPNDPHVQPGALQDDLSYLREAIKLKQSLQLAIQALVGNVLRQL